MTINTKFKLGDKVCTMSRYDDHRQIECSVCNNSKQVEISGVKYTCPACASGLHKHFERWYVNHHDTTIGQVRVEVVLAVFHNCNYFDEDEIQGDEGVIKEQYMLAATGIGSGTLWSAKDLFPTLAEAQAECDARNLALTAKEDALPK